MNEREQLAKDNGMTIELVNWFFETKKEGCGNAWFIMMAAMWEGGQDTPPYFRVPRITLQ